MEFSETSFQTKNGQSLVLRSPRGQDAQAMLDYLKTVCGETENLNRYPEEVTFTLEWERNFLQESLAEQGSLMLAAFLGDTVVANCNIGPHGKVSKVRHRAHFGIAIRRDWWGQGLGQKLTQICIQQARQMGYEQLELKVLSGNTRAIGLYEKLGFAHWGRVINGFKLKDGSYQDDLLMGMFL